MDNLNRQEEFSSGEMLSQIVEQLNQWARDKKGPPDWMLDPAIDDLPSPLADVAAMQGLDGLRFRGPDGAALQEAVWLRNIANWARGDQLDDLSRAIRLFDWTVRNIELETIAELQTGPRLYRLPWETLLLGRGAVLERAWVFVLLARQQGLDAAILAVPDPDDPEGGPAQPWAIGVLIEDEVFLFDPALSMPIPAADGIRLGGSGQLEIRPATLAEVAADETLLRRLNLDADRPYPLKSSDLGHVIALVEASPAYLAKRMRLVEMNLSGESKMVLSSSPTQEMERWGASPLIAETRLWWFPYHAELDRDRVTQEQAQERFVAVLPFYTSAGAALEPPPSGEEVLDESKEFYRPQRKKAEQAADDAPLHRARILHFKGELVGPQSATVFYQQARPSDEDLDKIAQILYNMAVEKNRDLPADERLSLEQLQQLTVERAALLHEVKHNASYWLGLLNLDEGLIQQQEGNEDAAAENFATAVDYLLKRTLAAWPDGPWTDGAHYNLGRVYEALGDYDEAIGQYATDSGSPAFYGNFLRARWLNGARLAEAMSPEETTLPQANAEELEVQPPVLEGPALQSPDGGAGPEDPTIGEPVPLEPMPEAPGAT